jgi:hypothetical protein
MLVTRAGKKESVVDSDLVGENNKLMKNTRLALWLLLSSQLLLLLSSLMQPPSSTVTIILRIIVPIVLIAIFGLMLAGFISPKRR